jgi:beta-galactosidase
MCPGKNEVSILGKVGVKLSIQNQALPQVGTLRSTLQLKTIDETVIPFQNGIPYPSFDPQERLVLSLAGTWKKQRFEADHDWTMSERSPEWISKTEEEFGYTSVDFDDQLWEEHSIPLPENKLTGKEEAGGAETYENGVWYRHQFSLDEQWDGKVVTLKSLAVSYVGDFWINGTYIGYHEGGYTPFAFDITPHLVAGNNTIVVRVDNPPWTTRMDTVPAVDNDFFNYTGIIHDIFLEATTGVHVARTDIVPKNTSGELDVTVVIENRFNQSKTVSLAGSVFDTDYQSSDWLSEPSAKSICNQRVDIQGLLKAQLELAPHEVRVLRFQVSISNPKLWSIRQPNLYVLEMLLSEGETEIDSFYTQFGIRTITTDHAKICLNEESIFLAGVARHEDWPDYGRTASWERIKSDFLKIADLKVNMVRTAHYPNHVYTFIMLDRLGLTAMSEIPLWQFETHHYEAQEQRGISYQMWREMVFSHYNRPSIIMWSTQNESKDVKLRKHYNERLVSEVKGSYPDGRLITQSAAADQPGFEDESMEPLDVAGWTMYFGIFHGSTPYEGTRDFIEKAHQKWPNKPIINTEYGIWSNADDSFLEKQVEIYQDVQLALIEKATVSPQGHINEEGYIAAIDYWTAFDWYVNHNRFYQTMGMLRMDRETEKPLYHEFVSDHQRLMGETNGIGKIAAPEEEEVTASVQYGKGLVEYSLVEKQDISAFNYFIIKVDDSESEDGVSVHFVDRAGNKASYETYGIQVGKEFDMYIPLWKLDQKVLSDVTKIQIGFKDGRELKVLGLTCSMTGK